MFSCVYSLVWYVVCLFFVILVCFRSLSLCTRTATSDDAHDIFTLALISLKSRPRSQRQAQQENVSTEENKQVDETMRMTYYYYLLLRGDHGK